jgi:hypothetical protein
MHLSQRVLLSVLGSCAVLSCGGARTEQVGVSSQALSGGKGTGPFQNSSGLSANVSTAGSIDSSNPFFRSLGTNGRECVSCHAAEYGFSITPDAVQQLFNTCETSIQQGTNPNTVDACAIFRTVDGSNSPNADVSTKAARQAAYSELLSKGLIRETFPFPPPGHPPMFDIIAASDPYGYGTTSLVSVFRRPLPATNLPFESGVMWDLRESSTNFLRAPYDLHSPDGGVFTLADQLKNQANDATSVHAQAAGSLSDAVEQSIVDFETQLYSAQRLDSVAGLLSDGANGGPEALSQQAVTPHCGNQFGLQSFAECSSFTFTTIVFNIFDGWANLQGTDAQTQKRLSIARGQALFNTRATTSPPNPFFDQSGKGTTCSACHSDFNTGATSVPIGFQNVTAGMGPNAFNNPPGSTMDFTSPDLPLYTLRCNAFGQSIFVATKGAAGCHDGSDGSPVDEVRTNDPGRALITGSWGSVGAFKCPTLRNLSARAPYFHDGSAATLSAVVDHYKAALGFQFTDDEKQDLVNFLSAL